MQNSNAGKALGGTKKVIFRLELENSSEPIALDKFLKSIRPIGTSWEIAMAEGHAFSTRCVNRCVRDAQRAKNKFDQANLDNLYLAAINHSDKTTALIYFVHSNRADLFRSFIRKNKETEHSLQTTGLLSSLYIVSRFKEFIENNYPEVSNLFFRIHYDTLSEILEDVLKKDAESLNPKLDGAGTPGLVTFLYFGSHATNGVPSLQSHIEKSSLRDDRKISDSIFYTLHRLNNSLYANPRGRVAMHLETEMGEFNKARIRKA